MMCHKTKDTDQLITMIEEKGDFAIGNDEFKKKLLDYLNEIFPTLYKKKELYQILAKVYYKENQKMHGYYGAIFNGDCIAAYLMLMNFDLINEWLEKAVEDRFLSKDSYCEILKEYYMMLTIEESKVTEQHRKTIDLMKKLKGELFFKELLCLKIVKVAMYREDSLIFGLHFSFFWYLTLFHNMGEEIAAFLRENEARLKSYHSTLTHRFIFSSYRNDGLYNFDKNPKPLLEFLLYFPSHVLWNLHQYIEQDIKNHSERGIEMIKYKKKEILGYIYMFKFMQEVLISLDNKKITPFEKALKKVTILDDIEAVNLNSINCLKLRLLVKKK